MNRRASQGKVENRRDQSSMVKVSAVLAPGSGSLKAAFEERSVGIVICALGAK